MSTSTPYQKFQDLEQGDAEDTIETVLVSIVVSYHTTGVLKNLHQSIKFARKAAKSDDYTLEKYAADNADVENKFINSLFQAGYLNSKGQLMYATKCHLAAVVPKKLIKAPVAPFCEISGCRLVAQQKCSFCQKLLCVRHKTTAPLGSPTSNTSVPACLSCKKKATRRFTQCAVAMILVPFVAVAILMVIVLNLHH